MLSLRKLPSVEATDFDGTDLKQICHFDIPADGIYDFSQSCLVFPTKIATSEAADTGVGVHNVCLKHRPQSLIKNCELSCTRGGMLETRTNNNFLNVNLNRYIYNAQNKASAPMFDGRNAQDEFGNNYSAFRDLHRDGDVTSVERKPELKVPLSHLFSIGAFPQYPAAALGTTRIRLEFQSNYYNGGLGNLIEELPLRFDDHTDDDKKLACDNYPATGGPAAPITTLVLTPISRSTAEVPLWVGQKINIQYTLAGGVHNADRIVLGLARDAGTNRVTITIANLIDPNTALEVTAISIIQVGAHNATYEVFQPEILLYKINPSANQLGSAMGKLKRGSTFPFRTWTLEQDNLLATTEFNKQYYLEPNCSNAVLWGQDPASANRTLECNLNNLVSFRCQMNNHDMTNVDVEPNDVLYKDRLMWFMSNAGLPLRQLTGNTTANSIVNPIPLQPVQQQYSVQMKGTAADPLPARNLHLYKQVTKVLKISGSSVSVV